MEENLKRLEEWYQNIKGNKMISLSEAKKLTKEMLDTDNIEEKNKIKEKLFFGTIHLLYKYLKNSYFIYQNSTEVDIDDIISASCEKWFSYCAEGKILEVEYYSILFLHFFTCLNKELFKTNFSFQEWGICQTNLIKFGVKYILYRKKFSNFSYLEFQKLFPQMASTNVYYMLEMVYKEIEKMNLLENENKISIQKLETLLPSLFYQYINETYNFKDKTSFICRQEVHDDYSELENAILREQVRNIFNETKYITKRRKDILAAYVGFYTDEPKSLLEIGKDYNYKRDRVRVKKEQACSYFRGNKHQEGVDLRKIYDDYDFTS